MDVFPLTSRRLPLLALVAALTFGVGLVVGCASTGPVESSKTAPDTAGTAPVADSGPTTQAKRERYSTYYEHFKSKDFSGARRDLLWILEHAPEFPRSDDRNFRRVIELYEGLANRATDDTVHAAYLDTAATYAATAPQEMEQLGIPFEQYEWELRKGRFMDRHGDALSEPTVLESPKSHYQRAFRLAPKKVDSYYIRWVLKSYLEAESLDGALAFADEASEMRGDDPKVATMADLVRDRVFTRNPEVKIARLEADVEQHPDSTQLLTELFTAYRDNGDSLDASRLADRLMNQNPSAETIREIAEMHLENGKHEAALAAYDQAVTDGAELSYQDYYNRGTAYQQIGQPARARREYRNALGVNEGFGQAYIAIGDLYARAVNRCSGEKMSRQDRAVYWVAVDKYEQAKRADPSVSDVATSRIDTYDKIFPTQEDIFYQSEWEAGTSFPIDYGCYSWIREITTVRAAPSTD